MKWQRGFSLIEVVISLAIGAVISMILFQTLFQTNLALKKTVTISGVERRITTAQKILERELSGICVPAIVWDESKLNIMEDENSESKKTDTDQEKKDANAAAPGMSDKKKEEKKVPQIFVYEKDDLQNLKTFTFITTNPVIVYGEPARRLSRVMYRLLPDPQRKDAFMLLHQQSDDLDPKKCSLDSEKAARGYPLLQGIKSISCEFLIQKPEKPDEKKDQQSEKKPASDKDASKKISDSQGKQKKEHKICEFESLTEWKEEEPESKKNKDDDTTPGKKDAQNKKDEKERKRPDLPSFIHMTLAVFDDSDRVHKVDYWFAPLYALNQGYDDEQKNSKQDKKDQAAFDEHQNMLKNAGAAQK